MKKMFGVSVYKEKFNFCSAHFLLFADGTRGIARTQLPGMGRRRRSHREGRYCNRLPASETYRERVVRFPRSPHTTANTKPTSKGGGKDDLIWAYHGEDRFAFPKRDVLLMDIPNTSTERLAEHICTELRRHIAESVSDVDIQRIRVSVEESSGQCGYYEEREQA